MVTDKQYKKALKDYERAYEIIQAYYSQIDKEKDAVIQKRIHPLTKDSNIKDIRWALNLPNDRVPMLLNGLLWSKGIARRKGDEYPYIIEDMSNISATELHRVRNCGKGARDVIKKVLIMTGVKMKP